MTAYGCECRSREVSELSGRVVPSRSNEFGDRRAPSPATLRPNVRPVAIARHCLPFALASASLFVAGTVLILLVATDSKDIGNDAIEVFLDSCKRRTRVRGSRDRARQRLDLRRDRFIEAGPRAIPRQEHIIDGLAHGDDEVYSQFVRHDETPHANGESDGVGGRFGSEPARCERCCLSLFEQ